MRKFSYEARDTASNRIVKSVVQSDTEQAAAKLLTSQGLVPLQISEASEERNIIAKITGRITSKDKVVFTRQLATLIGAGLPLTHSMHSVLEQTSNKRLQNIIQEIITDVEGGRPLSEAFGRHPQVFNKVFLALVSAGEASGTLDKALKRIATQQEKDAAMLSKIRGAMVYPAIVLVVIVAVVVWMLLTVVPQVAKLYTDMKQELPLLTQILIAIQYAIVNFWWLILIIVGFAIYFTGQYFRTESGIKTKDTLKLNVPVFKGMFRKLYMARFTRTGETLLATGVAMLDALHISGESVNNVVVQANVERAAEKVKGGKALSDALQPEPFILPMVHQMIKIGEDSGKIDEMMGKTAQVFEDELDEEIRTISTTIEPILMVVLAVVVGGLVGAVLFPIYSLVNVIQ